MTAAYLSRMRGPQLAPELELIPSRRRTRRGSPCEACPHCQPAVRRRRRRHAGGCAARGRHGPLDRRRDQGQRSRQRHLHHLFQAGQHLPLAHAAAARARLPPGHPDFPGHRRARPGRRCLDPFGPRPLPPRGRPGRAMGREPPCRRRARYADGADGGVLVRSLHRAVLPGGRLTRHQRGSGRCRPLLPLGLGRHRHRLPDGAHAAEAERHHLARRQALEPAVAPSVRDQPRGRRPPHVSDTHGISGSRRSRTIARSRSASTTRCASCRPRPCVRAWRTIGSATSSPP